MDTREQLAAYLAGDLDAAEQAALEAELAVDPRIRADLERLRALDAMLSSLPAVEPPAGYGERLRAAVDAELRRQMPSGARSWRERLMRMMPSGPLVPRLAAGAAALVVIAGVGIGIAQLVDPGARESATGQAALDVVEDGDDAPQADAPALGPLVVAQGGSYDASTVGALLEVYGQGFEHFETMAGRDGQGTPGAPPEPVGAEADPAAPAEAALDDGFDRQVGRCLETLDSDGRATLVYAELATFEGQPAIVFVVARPDDTTELWVLAHEDCGVLHFARAGAQR